jgi:hypothetical protein
MKFLKPWRDLVKELIRTRNDPNIIISYPKCGRTWHRASIGLYIAHANGLDPRKSLDTRFITQAAGLPATSYCHNGANFLMDIDPSNILNGSRMLWYGKNVLLIVRDPRAVLVSSFHHMSARSRRFDGTISEFIRNPRTGIEKILVAYNRWHEFGQKTENFMVQSYEGMRADHRAALCNALMFLGVEALNEEALEKTLALTTFEQLKKLEQEGYFEHRALRIRPNEANGAIVREGKVDGFKAALAEDDLEFIQQAVNRIGNPFEDIIGRKAVGERYHSNSMGKTQKIDAADRLQVPAKFN